MSNNKINYIGDYIKYKYSRKCIHVAHRDEGKWRQEISANISLCCRRNRQNKGRAVRYSQFMFSEFSKFHLRKALKSILKVYFVFLLNRLCICVCHVDVWFLYYNVNVKMELQLKKKLWFFVRHLILNGAFNLELLLLNGFFFLNQCVFRFIEFISPNLQENKIQKKSPRCWTASKQVRASMRKMYCKLFELKKKLAQMVYMNEVKPLCNLYSHTGHAAYIIFGLNKISVLKSAIIMCFRSQMNKGIIYISFSCD